MATRWETFPITLSGGLITNLGRIEQGIQAPGSATRLQNFEPSVEKGYTKISGYTKFSSDEVTGTGQIFGVVALSDTQCLAVRNGKFLYSAGGAWTDKGNLTNSAITRIYSHTYNFSGTKKTVVVDGVNKPAYFDHTALTVTYPVSVPAEVEGARFVEVFSEHLFFSKGVYLSFAAPYTDDDFTIANGAGQINIGEEITGLKVFRDQLFIFTLTSIKRLAGSTVDDFALVDVTTDTGCLCGFTIQEVGGDIMYLGPDGIRYLSASERNNDFGLNRASEKIQGEILDIVNTNCYYATTTISSKNQYRIFSFLSGTPRANSVGYLATKYSNQSVEDIAWAKMVGMKVYHLSKYQARDLETILFCSDTGFIYRMDSGSSFDGEDIEAIFETPYMPINDPKIRKTIYKHTLYAKPTGLFEIELTLKFDYNQPNSSKPPTITITGDGTTSIFGSAIFGTSLFGGSVDEEYYNNVLGSGFTVALNYREKSTNPSYNLNFVILEFRNNERR